MASFLGVDQRPDATLWAINQKQLDGSCEWLTEHPTFVEWANNPLVNWGSLGPVAGMLAEKLAPKAPLVLWLHGRPGTGKSVAAGHVIRYLQSRKFDCSFYFFRHDDTASFSIVSLLRSLAFQMAEASVDIRRAIMSIAEDGMGMNNDDYLALWTNLFVGRIFKAKHAEPWYWVIDAVDECPSISALISLLCDLDVTADIRVLITSRPGGEVGKRISSAQPNMPFLEMATGEYGTLEDIEMFLKAWAKHPDNTSVDPGLVSDVLAMSNGIFLWASLIAAILENTYTVEDRQDVLQKIPPEMDDFYSRTITSLTASPSAELAKCVLTWVICSHIPLHLAELAEAVKMDIGRTMTASARELETITHHLIFVDNQSRAHIAHQTTSRFLTQPMDHGFWVDRPAANSRISELCLKVLCGAHFAPSRVRRERAVATGDTAATVHFADYAAFNFSHHLVQGSPVVDSTLLMLNKFLRTNVLTWIERIASSGSLQSLQQTAQLLKTYLSQRAEHQRHIGIESRTVSAWASDIYHIVAVFHSNLISSPSSIYPLIPYLCPPKSIIREIFAKPSKKLRITGHLEEDWNDRLACCLFPEEASSIECSNRLLAVGLSGG
ncbi:NACHT domain-containing protein, partial [Candidatus Bathyarchaeota archaeon]|nr:NACHT domain-containing protein [Candidatus Bathyarchaeota archaeon]